MRRNPNRIVRRVAAVLAAGALLALPSACKGAGDSNGGANGGNRNSSSPVVSLTR